MCKNILVYICDLNYVAYHNLPALRPRRRRLRPRRIMPPCSKVKLPLLVQVKYLRQPPPCQPSRQLAALAKDAMPLKKGEPAMSALDECMNDQAGIADSLLAYATFMEDQVRLPYLRYIRTNNNLTKSCSSPSPPFPHSPTLRTHPSTHLQTHNPHQQTHAPAHPPKHPRSDPGQADRGRSELRSRVERDPKDRRRLAPPLRCGRLSGT